MDTNMTTDLIPFSDLITGALPELPALPLSIPLREDLPYRFFHINEISADKPAAHRQSMANVFSSLNRSGCTGLYVLSGRPEGVDLYLGVAANNPQSDVHETGKLLKAGFEGHFLGGQLQPIADDNRLLNDQLQKSRVFGQLMGVPSVDQDQQKDPDDDFQGIERLVNSLLGETWQLILVAEPASEAEIEQTLAALYRLASEVSTHIKHSVQQAVNSGQNYSATTGKSDSRTQGTSNGDSRTKTLGTSDSRGKTYSNSSSGRGSSNTEGTSDSISEARNTGTSTSDTQGTSASETGGRSQGSSLSLTRERIDKQAERLMKHLDETQIERCLQGQATGLYKTAIYLAAETASTYKRLAAGMVSIFQGKQSSFSPLKATRLPEDRYTLPKLLQLRSVALGEVSQAVALAHSAPLPQNGLITAATWLNSSELALMAGIPTREVPGITLRKSVDFGLNTRHTATPSRNTTSSGVVLGHVVQHGRILEKNPLRLSLSDLSKHVFITGVTGAGKTTTCLQLLLASNLPFLVIEPAKTEYRALHGQGVEVEYYCLGREDLTPFRLNPFELLSNQQKLASHIDILKATLTAVFPMEAAMPQIVEEAIIKAYEKKGWMIHENINIMTDDPWENGSTVWPTFSDMINELGGVITAKGMGTEFEEKYKGSLVARLSNLSIGTKGRMLNTRRSMNFDALLDKRVVIELEEIKDEQDKALFMGLIITRLAECMKQRHRHNPQFQHLTLIEEAHRLLSKPDPSDGGARKMGVEMFANLLAEVRKYGEGLIIADQIPNKLVPDVIKNTNTKIVHRLFAADDRRSIGDAMGLNDEQKDFLPMLLPGETVVYCGGWHAAIRVQITERVATHSQPLEEKHIRHYGQQQLWAQRAVLLPYVAQHPALQSSEDLAYFLEEAKTLWAQLLWLNPCNSKHKLPVSQRNPLRTKCLHTAESLQKRFHMDLPALADGLYRVFRDVEMSHDFSEESYNHLQGALKNGLASLSTSLEAFDTFVNGMESNEVFKSSLAKISSL
jgi:hypothetical protein